MSPSSVKPAADWVLSLLSEVMVHCTYCSRDIRASLSAFDFHQCSTTPKEVQMAVDTLRRVASYSPLDNCMLKVHMGGAVKLISYKVRRLLCMVKQHFLTLDSTIHTTA